MWYNLIQDVRRADLFRVYGVGLPEICPGRLTMKFENGSTARLFFFYMYKEQIAKIWEQAD